jgi:branched-chain amino acid transport system ATP-binding protein
VTHAQGLGLLLIVLGRALMSAPTFLLIDEPSVGLAPILVSR